MKNEIKIFEQNNIRSVYDEEQEKWYFSVVDLIAILTESENPANYWKVLKNRLKKEGGQLVTICNQLKMKAAESTQATGLQENKSAAQIGGNIAKHAREEYEDRTGGKVVSDSNFLPKKSKTKQIENKKD